VMWHPVSRVFARRSGFCSGGKVQVGFQDPEMARPVWSCTCNRGQYRSCNWRSGVRFPSEAFPMSMLRSRVFTTQMKKAMNDNHQQRTQSRPPFPGWMLLDESNDIFPVFYPPLRATGLASFVTEEAACSFAKTHAGSRVIPVDDDVLMGACRWFFEKEDVKYLFVCEWLKGEGVLEVTAMPLDQFLGRDGGAVVAEGQHRLNPKDLQVQRGKSMNPRNVFGR